MSGRVTPHFTRAVSILFCFRDKKTFQENHMKQKFQIIVSASAATFLAFTAAAQQTTTDGSPARERMTQARVERMNDAAKVTDIIGMTVKNLQGEKLGTVED